MQNNPEIKGLKEMYCLDMHSFNQGSITSKFFCTNMVKTMDVVEK